MGFGSYLSGKVLKFIEDDNYTACIKEYPILRKCNLHKMERPTSWKCLQHPQMVQRGKKVWDWKDIWDKMFRWTWIKGREVFFVLFLSFANFIWGWNYFQVEKKKRKTMKDYWSESEAWYRFYRLSSLFTVHTRSPWSLPSRNWFYVID